MTIPLLRRTALTVLAGAATACSPPPEATPSGPNILWILWDTVRADHLSVYGYEKPTTPYLRRWAEQGRVYRNCLSPAPWTVPSHASMFTGLLPSEHGASNDHRWLDSEFTTVAELLRDTGYQTFLWSANPHVSDKCNYDQGFDRAEYPWDPQWRQAAFEAVKGKIPDHDRSSELGEVLAGDKIRGWEIKASGSLAAQALLDWLEQRDRNRPYFAFVNYMEAHRPYIPPETCRRRVMTPSRSSARTRWIVPSATCGATPWA